MKKSITYQQWFQLNGEQQLKFDKDIFNSNYPWRKVNINRMIEFLGDDMTGKGSVQFNRIRVILNKRVYTEEKNLLDALWEAVKYKLKKSN